MLSIFGYFLKFAMTLLALVFPVFCIEAAVNIGAREAIVFCVITVVVLLVVSLAFLADLISEIQYFAACRRLERES